MGVWEIEAVLLVDHRHLQQFGELDEQSDALLRSRAAVRDNHRVLGIDQELGRLAERRRIRVRRGRCDVARRIEALELVAVDRLLLQSGVERDHHRAVGRCHRELVGAHEGLREVLQRHRLVVPFGEVAHQQVDVLRRVHGRHAWRTGRGVKIVAADQDDGHAVGPGVVHRHGRMLQADGAVHQRHLRLAGGLEVAVAHRHRRLLVHAGDELRHLVVAVVDHRLVQRAEARCRVRIAVVDLQALDDVDHEIGRRPALDLGCRLAQTAGFGCNLVRRRHHGRGQPLVRNRAGTSRLSRRWRRWLPHRRLPRRPGIYDGLRQDARLCVPFRPPFMVSGLIRTGDSHLNKLIVPPRRNAGKANCKTAAGNPTWRECAGSEVRSILAASPNCGLLNQSRTKFKELLVSFDSEVRK